MTKGGRRRGASAMTCLSCGAVLDDCQSFCDAQCAEYAQHYGYGHYNAPKLARGISIHPDRIRKDFRVLPTPDQEVLMEEEWRPVPGFEGRYEASDRGRVRSVRTPGSRTRGVVLKVRANRGDGYQQVTLYAGARHRELLVHVLVAWAFLGPQSPDMQVRHRDLDNLNNAASNLYYATRSEIRLESVRRGTHPQVGKTHCPQNHPYDEANTYISPSRPTNRQCRACHRERRRRAA